ncbi:hypothetical protein CERSUDRAFT_118710 [Gelatoporia subvermispora B]|uniref:MYND-type domain-containing protein n=1 Tax=Ceriporiopsis subvermispora (strain B) TaxID=914234 RepID=M2QJP3_CERS8|nr:hypothetical protein CERSUDRAFT_118710 [Gelatoporia subvermispora B]
MALKLIVLAFHDSTEQALRMTSWYIPHETKPGEINNLLQFNAHWKLSIHLTSPRVNRPFDAMPHFYIMLDTVARNAETGQPIWSQFPALYEAYADARVSCGLFDEDTRIVLEHVLQACDALTKPPMMPVHARLMSRIHLANVLQRLGQDPVAQREHTEWAAQMLRKNPRLVLIDKLHQVFARDDPPHPVLTALGGQKWLARISRTPTAGMDERLLRRCETCRVREPQKTLFRCAACGMVWYCSKQCQKEGWQTHKEICKGFLQQKADIDKIRQTDPSLAQFVEDFFGWRDAACSNRLYAYSCALGLHRDPSRGRTHLIMGELEYTPQVSKDVRFKFRVTKCGVFRIEDVLVDIESLATLKNGAGRRYVDKYMQEADAMDRTKTRTPILVFMGVPGRRPLLKPYSWALDSLREFPHTQDWRDLVNNKGAPPECLRLRSRAQDAEFVF